MNENGWALRKPAIIKLYYRLYSITYIYICIVHILYLTTRIFWQSNYDLLRTNFFYKLLKLTSLFQVIHCSGYLKVRPVIPQNGTGPPYFQNVGLVAIGQSLPTNSITEMKLHSNMFMFRASVDLKLIFSETK